MQRRVAAGQVTGADHELRVLRGPPAPRRRPHRGRDGPVGARPSRTRPGWLPSGRPMNASTSRWRASGPSPRTTVRRGCRSTTASPSMATRVSRTFAPSRDRDALHPVLPAVVVAARPGPRRATDPRRFVTAAAVRGSATSSSATSSTARAAAIASVAAAWSAAMPRFDGVLGGRGGLRLGVPAAERVGAHGSTLQASSTPGGASATGGCRTRRSPEPPVPQRRGGDRPPAQRVGQQQRPAVRADPDEQLVVAAAEVEVVAVGERQLERQHVRVAPLA